MRMIRLFTALMIAALLISVCAFAMEDIDPNRAVQLTISFQDNGVGLADAKFSVYRVASINQKGKLTPVTPFNRYNVDLEVESESDLGKIATTLEGYVLRDDIQATAGGTTDGTGTLRFPASGSKLKTGLYLVLGQRYLANGKVYNVQPTLVQLPGLNADKSQWIYDLEIKPKFDGDPNVDFISRKVLKVWKNTEDVEQLPKKVVVRLLKDGEVFDTVELNAEKLWRHTWEELNPAHHWTVVEEELDDYSVTVTREGITFVVTNTYDPDDPEPTPTPKPTPPPGDKPGTKLPQTGQVWWPVPMLISVGLLFIIIGLIRRRGN